MPHLLSHHTPQVCLVLDSSRHHLSLSSGRRQHVPAARKACPPSAGAALMRHHAALVLPRWDSVVLYPLPTPAVLLCSCHGSHWCCAKHSIQSILCTFFCFLSTLFVLLHHRACIFLAVSVSSEHLQRPATTRWHPTLPRWQCRDSSVASSSTARTVCATTPLPATYQWRYSTAAL